MSLEEKLKGWREATEALAPSEKLQASLQTAISAPSAAVGTVVKVLFVVAIVGAIGFAFVGPQVAGWRWRGGPRTTDAGVPADVACGTRDHAEPVMIPSPAGYEESIRTQGVEYRRQLAARPKTCEAQRYPLEQLLMQQSVRDEEATRLISRLVVLCGAEVPPHLLGRLEERTPCDDSDWCRPVLCKLNTEDCARRWAALPTGTCRQRIGKQTVLAFVCSRFLKGEAPEAEVRAESSQAWCLKPEARSPLEEKP